MQGKCQPSSLLQGFNSLKTGCHETSGHSKLQPMGRDISFSHREKIEVLCQFIWVGQAFAQGHTTQVSE